MVSWTPKRKKWTEAQQAGPFTSFDRAFDFARSDPGPVNAKSCTILKEDDHAINAGKFFLCNIVK
jgi:hypothetical protein